MNIERHVDDLAALARQIERGAHDARLDRARRALRQVCKRLGVRFSLGAPVIVGLVERERRS